MDTLFYTAGYLAIALLAFLALKPFDKRLAFGFGLLFVAYLVLDDFITGLPYAVRIFDLNPAQWNWARKVYSILFSMAVIAGLGMNASAIGLVLPRRNIKAGTLAFPMARTHSSWVRPYGLSAAESSTAGSASAPAACFSRCWPTASRTWLFTSRR